MNIFARLVSHSCDLQPACVQHRQLVLAPVSTLILYRCKCARVHVEEIPGQWTLEQVLGEQAPQAEDDPVPA